MRILYLDNFRGFSNAFIPIKDVNFLLGENSTGKTSLLSIMYLLSTPHFWFGQAFNTEQFQFGTFKDIVSITSPDRTYFKIGVFECKDNPLTPDGNSGHERVSHAAICLA
jgi:predicted ATP-dependent endonuclease of OLD family